MFDKIQKAFVKALIVSGVKVRQIKVLFENEYGIRISGSSIYRIKLSRAVHKDKRGPKYKLPMSNEFNSELVQLVESDRWSSWRTLCKTLIRTRNIRVSPDTLKRRLHLLGIRSFVAKSKPYNNERIASQRLQFAREHIQNSHVESKRWLFCDESRINLFSDDLFKVWVKRRRGESLKSFATKKKMKFRGKFC
jgi:hypothetical protein